MNAAKSDVFPDDLSAFWNYSMSLRTLFSPLLANFYPLDPRALVRNFVGSQVQAAVMREYDRLPLADVWIRGSQRAQGYL